MSMKSRCTSDNVLLIGILIGVIIGVVSGFALRSTQLSESWLMLISYPGELFMRALKMIILPLVICSLIVGTASLDAKMNGKIALRTLIYFIITSIINALFGVFLVQLVHPGNPSMRKELVESVHKLDERKNTLADSFFDLGRNAIPSNIFTALFQQTQTVYDPPNYERTVVLRNGTNTLGIMVFAFIFGTVLGTRGERARPLISILKVVDEVIMTIVRGITWFTPVGVASLICSKLLNVDDLILVFQQLGLFILTVNFGLIFYFGVVLQIFYFIVTRRNPFKFFWGLVPALATAFSTASAAAAIPVAFKCLDNLKIDSRIARFILPVGSTLNKNGTALFQPVACIFIAQMNGIELGIGDIVTVIIISLAISISGPSIPSASLTIMFITLNAVHVPTQDIALLFAVDWFNDRIRTLNNILGDLYGTVLIQKLSQKELQAMDEMRGSIKIYNKHSRKSDILEAVV